MTKHGIGVMFCTDDLIVDVPHGIARPGVFDSDRFFDYLKSRKLLGLIDGESGERRQRLAELFREWSDKGLLERRGDERGHVVFPLAAIGQGIEGES